MAFAMLLATLSCDAFRSADLATKRKTALQELVHGPNAIVVLVNPGTCAFTRELAAQLTAVSLSTHIPLQIVLFGIGNDSDVVRSIRSDLVLPQSTIVMSQSDLERRVGLPEGGTPTLFVMRRGEVEIVTHGLGTAGAGRWLEKYLLPDGN